MAHQQTSHDPKEVAANMVAIRGVEAALARCDKYISGAIRSENTPAFWLAVRANIDVVEG